MSKHALVAVGGGVLAVLLPLLCAGAPATPGAKPEPAPVPAAAKAPSAWTDAAPPEGASTVRIKSGTEENVYAIVTGSQPLTLKVQGPCQLRVKVRLELKTGAKSTVPFVVTTAVDQEKSKSRAYRAQPSKKASFVGGDNVVPSGSENIDLDLPAGEHTVRVALPEKDVKRLCVRHLTAKPKPAPAAAPGKAPEPAKDPAPPAAK